MKKIQLVIILFLGAAASQKAYSQNNASPYSIIGIGDIENSYFDRSSGMANSGTAISSSRYLYQSNPASYSSLDDHFFHVDVAARFKAVTYSGQPISSTTSNQSTDLQFKKITTAIKLKKWWGISVGLLPFSTANYSFYAAKPIQGTSITANAYNEGSGSTNQLYIANSFKINKNLSFGIQSAYLFGQLQQKETLMTTITDSLLTTTSNIFLSNLYFKSGLQYHTKISPALSVSAGLTGSLQTKLRANTTLLVTSGNTTLVNNQEFKNDYFTLPVVYSGGLAATLHDKYTFSADYNFQSWSDLKYAGTGYVLTNSSRYSAGFEYSNKLRLRDQSFEKYFFQAGLFYSDSYLKINGQQLNDLGGTIGAGFTPLRNPKLAVQGALEIGKRGTTSNGLVKENYTQFTISVTYIDFWFKQKKFYD